MKIVVQKFGGSSLSTPEKIRAVARKVIDCKKAGYEVAVVVSAMGDTTDRFLGLAHAVSHQPVSRELDLLLTAGEQISMSLLSMAISAEGQRAVALTGPQAGILTCGSHNRARILQVQPTRVLHELAQGTIVVVAGFQGLSCDGEVTTLGRGGSDTSAVALAVALKARRCDIFSDVAGVYSGDPRVIPSPRFIERLSYSEMLEMSRHGARVLCAEAVEHAQLAGLEVRALSTFSDGPGTTISRESSAGLSALGVAGRSDLVRMKVVGRDALSRLGPFLVRHRVLHHHLDDIYLVADNYASTQVLVAHAHEELGDGVEYTQGLAAASVVGASLAEIETNRARAASALAAAGLGVLDVFAGPLSLTCLVQAQDLNSAMTALHHSFVYQEVLA